MNIKYQKPKNKGECSEPKLIYYGLLAFFSSIIFGCVTVFYNLHEFRTFCSTTYDFGLFLQAIKDFSWRNMNPYLLNLNVSFLNDHWHPGLILARIPGLFFSLSTSLILTEVFFLLVAAWVPFLLVKKNQLHLSCAVFINMYMLLNYYQWKAVFYPVHPAIWAHFFLMLGSFFVIKSEKKYGLAFFTILLASCFGEQFSLSLFGFSIATFFCIRRYFLSLFSIFFSLIWTWFHLSGRAYFLGPIFYQTDRVAFYPLEVFKKYNWDLYQLKSILLFFAVNLPLFYFISKKMKKKDFLDFLPILGIFAPLVLGRILSGSFHAYYDSTCICALASLGMLFFKSSQLVISYRSLVFSFVFFLLFSYFDLRMAYNTVINRKNKCIRMKENVSSIQKERSQNLRNAIEIIENQGGAHILVFGNLVPNFIEAFPQANIYTLGSNFKNKTKKFDKGILFL